MILEPPRHFSLHSQVRYRDDTKRHCSKITLNAYFHSFTAVILSRFFLNLRSAAQGTNWTTSTVLSELHFSPQYSFGGPVFGDHSTENDEYGDSDDEHTETWALNDSDGVDIEGADGTQNTE